jgi:cbb3-type cytochrome oxidase maturation protein
MYFPYFIAYMLIGLVIALPVFFWALASGQFHDQQRARFLPLHGSTEPAPPAPPARFGRLEAYLLFALAAIGLTASAAVLVFALIQGG